ncbi:DUF1566 domain-containing protein [Methylomonas sp. TEB]|uniref:Lcl domain-containing protein n=1 Tax=Methylomonas sp. TEB TaxID=3398229 RepID=UPI0039F5ECB5
MRINPPLLATGLLLSLTSLTAEATLTPYTSAGQSLVYSSVSNITWTGDANLLGTLEASNPNLVSTIISTIGSVTDTPNYYDTPEYSGTHTLNPGDFPYNNGLVTWFGAQAFVGYLNAINYAGSQQWALPSASANPQTGYNQTGGHFGQLFYNELGGTEQPYAYWSGTEYSSNANYVWVFGTSNGFQDYGHKNSYFNVWTVNPGQVSAVPIPGAAWLFGTGLVGLHRLKRRE